MYRRTLNVLNTLLNFSYRIYNNDIHKCSDISMQLSVIYLMKGFTILKLCCDNENRNINHLYGDDGALDFYGRGAP